MVTEQIEKLQRRKELAARGVYVTGKATFNGNHNQVKTMVLLLLYWIQMLSQRKREPVHHYPARAIAHYTGCNAVYVANRCGTWSEWKYLKRRPVADGKHTAWGYALADRGKHFLLDRVPTETLIECRDAIHKQSPSLNINWLKIGDK